MNNLINSRREIYLNSRLQSARRKSRMQHEDLEKQLLRLHRERNQLYKQQRELGWVDLHPPIMRGWKRYFVLREDVAKGKQNIFFENILLKINTIQLSSRKDFKIKKRKGGKKIYVLKPQELLFPCEVQFKKLNFNEKEIQFFEVRYVRKSWMKQPEKVYVFTEPWRFVLRIRPNVITKVRAHDVEIEKRIGEINDFLEQRALTGKLSNLLRGHDYWGWDRSKRKWEKNPLKNKPVPLIVDQM